MIKKQKILILGGSGFLGATLISHLAHQTVIAPSHNEIDLLDINRVYKYIEHTQPDIILYSAGITKIDLAESNNELAFLLNATVPEQIASFASKSNIQFIYISTDAVFDGYNRKFIFSETDAPKAKSIYGKSKLKGEELVLLANADNTVIRLITLFGIDNTHKNFITRILKDLQQKKSILGITDQIQNPLLVNIATEAIAYIINKQLTGIFHL